METKTSPDSLAQFDVRTGKYERIGALRGSAYKVRLGPSGRIYIGEVGGSVSVYDPSIHSLLSYKKPAGRRIFWGVYTMEVEEPWIYCGMTNRGNWFLTIIDTRTGKSTNYFDKESGQKPAVGGHSVYRTEAGNIFFGSYLLKDGSPQTDENGKPQKLDPPDRSRRLPSDSPWENMWRVSGYAGRIYEEPKQAGIEFDMTNAEPNTWNGGVATILWRKIEIKGLPLVGCSPASLTVAPDGKMVGVAKMYGSVFRFDPSTGRSELIGTASGSVLQILALKHRTYFCGYVSFLAVYDHNRPYTLSGANRLKAFTEDINPKLYRTGAKWTKQMVMGPDGRIYLGGHYGRHKTGGGLSIFDPRTNTMQNIRKPFLYLGVTGIYPLSDGKTLAIGTTPVGNVPPKTGSIFLYDTEKKELIREVKLQLQTHPDQLFVAQDGRVIGVSRYKETDKFDQPIHYTLVYGVELENGKLLFRKRYAGRAFTGVSGYDRTPLVRGPDGCGWLFVDEALCRIHPDGTLEKVRHKMKYRGHIIWQEETMYIYNDGRAYYRRFANIVKIPDLFKE